VITQIDVRRVLATLGPDRPDLVTRPTGRAVRTSIEAELARLSGRKIIVLDFTSVRTMDCSCADEIVAKLIQAYLGTELPLPLDAFFLVRGLDEHQRLALVAETAGSIRLIGDVAEQARMAFERVAARGRADAQDLVDELAWTLDDARAALEDLALRHLVMLEQGHYLPPTAAA
jgi:hypothetical protein